MSATSGERKLSARERRERALAAAGKIIVSRSTREAAGTLLAVIELPPAKVKGKPGRKPKAQSDAMLQGAAPQAVASSVSNSRARIARRCRPRW